MSECKHQRGQSSNRFDRGFYKLSDVASLGLFDLVRSPDRQRLPQVLTRAEVARLFAVIREERFRVVQRLIYACGLRVGEALLRIWDQPVTCQLMPLEILGLKTRC